MIRQAAVPELESWIKALQPNGAGPESSADLSGGRETVRKVSRRWKDRHGK